jgi:pimeloyl-ACP methyl ester carboxylesterase
MFVEVAGTRVHYTVRGHGPGLVLVHGSTVDAATNFGQVIDRFADRWTVIAPDYAGSGQTTMPPHPLTVDLLVDQIVAATRAVTDEPVDLVGFSLGAVAAAALAGRHPERVRRLVAVAGWTHPADPRLRLGLELWGRLLRADLDLCTTYGLLIGASPDFLAALDETTIDQLRQMRPAPGAAAQIDLDLRADIRPDLPAITAPTLVVGCAQDHLVPVRHARRLHEAIPRSEYIEIDSGHVVFAEQPDRMVEEIRRFLLTSSDRGAPQGR